MSSGRLLASKNDHSNAVVSVCRFTSLSVVSSPDPRRLFTSTGKRVKVRSMGGQKLTSILALSWTLTLVTVVAKSADELECNVRPQDTVSVTNILSEGQDLYGESGNPPRFPCWFNLGLARAGQQFASKNIAQVGLAHFLSLVPLVGNQQLRRALYSTHRSNTPETAFKRYTATALHVQLWYKADILSPEWMKSLLTVRRIHDGTGKYLNQLRKSNKTDFYRPLVTEASNAGRFQPNKRIWNAFKADLAQSRYTELVSNASLKRILRHQPKEVYNQYTFAMTQWAFVALPILFPNRVMITRWTDTELRGFAHLWAVICYVLGMDERFIICRDPSDFEGCQRFLYDMFQVHIVPSLFDMDYEGELMVEAVLRVSFNWLVPRN